MKSPDKLYLIDGSGYIFRAYYAIRALSTSKGVPTNAVVGFARMMARLIASERPSHMVIVFDAPGDNFRHLIYDQYKANRDAPPDDLIPQFNLVFRCAEAMGVPVFRQPAFEADDVLATLTKKAKDAKLSVVVVSADKDLMQLVDDEHEITMWDPMKRVLYHAAEVETKMGVPPHHVIDLLALAGDNSDNIPGVPRIGPKSAAKLIHAYGDVENAYIGVQTLTKPKAYERSLIENIDLARLSKRLVALNFKAPVDFDEEQFRFKGVNKQSLGDFLEEIEARTILRDFNLRPEPDHSAPHLVLHTDPQPENHATDLDNPDNKEDKKPQLLRNENSLKEVIAVFKEQGALTLYPFVEEGNPRTAQLIGLSLYHPEVGTYYIPLAHGYLGVGSQLESAVFSEHLNNLFSDPKITLTAYRLKSICTLLARFGITIKNRLRDPYLAAYVADPGRSSFSLEPLCVTLLGEELGRQKELTGKGKSARTFAMVPCEEASVYCQDHIIAVTRLCHKLEETLKENNLYLLYTDMELPLLPVLQRMESYGIQVDREGLGVIGNEFSKRLGLLQAQAHEEAEGPFNLNSPKQLAHIFFEKKGYPVIKKTKTGFSTAHEVLTVLAKDYPLPAIILQYRELAKLKSTYIDALERVTTTQYSRVHTTFNQAGAATGRLSSTEPNLQNIPIRTAEGKRIRELFIPAPGWVLISADYSQVELRILAHLSQDPRFQQAFHQGEDIHRATAMEVLTQGEEPTTEERRRAKAINFGIIYGLSEFGLSRQLGIPRAEAKAFIAQYFMKYQGIKKFLDQSVETARATGYAVTMCGRQRPIDELNSRNQNSRKAAERIAMNTPIQGSAADLIKKAMLAVDKEINGQGLQAKLLLQVHDELIVEAPPNEADQVVQLLKKQMSEVMPLSVPLEVMVGQGSNWAVIH